MSEWAKQRFSLVSRRPASPWLESKPDSHTVVSEYNELPTPEEFGEEWPVIQEFNPNPAELAAIRRKKLIVAEVAQQAGMKPGLMDGSKLSEEQRERLRAADEAQTAELGEVRAREYASLRVKQWRLKTPEEPYWMWMTTWDLEEMSKSPEALARLLEEERDHMWSSALKSAEHGPPFFYEQTLKAMKIAKGIEE